VPAKNLVNRFCIKRPGVQGGQGRPKIALPGLPGSWEAPGRLGDQPFLQALILQFLFCFRVRASTRMGPHQAFFDEWGLEGSCWLLLALPGSSWRDPTRATPQKRNCQYSNGTLHSSNSSPCGSPYGFPAEAIGFGMQQVGPENRPLVKVVPWPSPGSPWPSLRAPGLPKKIEQKKNVFSLGCKELVGAFVSFNRG
jgi:hypothetical protein